MSPIAKFLATFLDWPGFAKSPPHDYYEPQFIVLKTTVTGSQTLEGSEGNLLPADHSSQLTAGILNAGYTSFEKYGMALGYIRVRVAGEGLNAAERAKIMNGLYLRFKRQGTASRNNHWQLFNFISGVDSAVSLDGEASAVSHASFAPRGLRPLPQGGLIIGGEDTLVVGTSVALAANVEVYLDIWGGLVHADAVDALRGDGRECPANPDEAEKRKRDRAGVRMRAIQWARRNGVI